MASATNDVVRPQGRRHGARAYKHYGKGDASVTALTGVDLRLDALRKCARGGWALSAHAQRQISAFR